MRLNISLASLLFVPASLAAQHHIEIVLPSVDQANYERPYVAAWIANADNQTEEVLLLWQAQERWVKELKYFWRRVLRKNPNVIDGVTGATRGPGLYRFSWDNDVVNPLRDGHYKLCAEVSREHGGRTAKCLEFELPLTEAQQLHLADGEFTDLRIKATP